MTIPALTPLGFLPEGRHVCTLEDLESQFATNVLFSASVGRVRILGDLLSALALLRNFDAQLVERIWIGGSYATTKVEPSDIDVTFILNASSYASLSGSKKDKIAKLCRKGGFEGVGLKVDGFFFARERIANPWDGPGVGRHAQGYASIRGAWDDWWTRNRSAGTKEDEPMVEDADPVRGYLEVILNG
jgi:hypothetical protein